MSSDKSRPYGARVYKINEQTILVKQTIKNGDEQNAPYVVDGQRELHVDIADDKAIANAVRDAIHGRLPKGK